MITALGCCSFAFAGGLSSWWVALVGRLCLFGWFAWWGVVRVVSRVSGLIGNGSW